MNPQELTIASPKVSIITIFYNRAYCVEETLSCLINQSFRDIEVIVVDDGSVDNTVELIAKFDDPRIRLISLKNGGFTRAVTEGVRQARAPLIAIHGSGDFSHPERIAKQYEVMEVSPDVGIVGCRIANQHLGRETYHFSPENSDKFEGRYRDLFTELMKSSVFTHGEVMYRRSLYDLVGGYREEFVYSQDYDLWFRMSEHTAYRIVNEILYTRRSPVGTVRSSPRKIIVQQHLSELARQCAHQRQAGRRDLVDMYGHYAVLLTDRSRLLGDILVGNGVNLMVQLSDMTAFELVQRGVRESSTPRNLLYLALMATYKSHFFKLVVQPGLKAWRRWRG